MADREICLRKYHIKGFSKFKIYGLGKIYDELKNPMPHEVSFVAVPCTKRSWSNKGSKIEILTKEEKTELD